MSDPETAEAMREAARQAIRELVPEIVAHALGTAGTGGHANGNGHTPPPQPNDAAHAPVVPAPPVAAAHAPVVPAPPVAAVLRPSTWTAPAAPGEVIGEGVFEFPPAMRNFSQTHAGNAAQIVDNFVDNPGDDAELVTIENDEDLQHFARSLLARLESPRERRALRAGRIRFRLARAGGRRAAPGGQAASPAPAVRIAKGAVTERVVLDAAEKGARLVLARGAVLTPLARDQARALGVQIEKEGKC